MPVIHPESIRFQKNVASDKEINQYFQMRQKALKVAQKEALKQMAKDRAQKKKQDKIEDQIALGLEQHKEWEPVGTQKKPAAQTKRQAKPTSAKKVQSLQKIQKKPATASQKERQMIKKKPSGAPKKAQQIQRRARNWQKTLKKARELHQFMTHKCGVAQPERPKGASEIV